MFLSSYVSYSYMYTLRSILETLTAESPCPPPPGICWYNPLPAAYLPTKLRFNFKFLRSKNTSSGENCGRFSVNGYWFFLAYMWGGGGRFASKERKIQL